MQCLLCENVHSKDLLAATGRQVCVPCATAIAAGLETLKTRPGRRQEIAMRFHEAGLRLGATDARLMELVEYGTTDEQIRDAVTCAKQQYASINAGLVLAILKGRRANQPPPKQEPQSDDLKPSIPHWQAQGFANEKDYEACDWSYTQSGRKLKWTQFKSNWLDEAK